MKFTIKTVFTENKTKNANIINTQKRINEIIKGYQKKEKSIETFINCWNDLEPLFKEMKNIQINNESDKLAKQDILNQGVNIYNTLHPDIKNFEISKSTFIKDIKNATSRLLSLYQDIELTKNLIVTAIDAEEVLFERYDKFQKNNYKDHDIYQVFKAYVDTLVLLGNKFTEIVEFERIDKTIEKFNDDTDDTDNAEIGIECEELNINE